MDEGEPDFCTSKDLSDEVVPSICSMGSFFDDLLNDGHHHQCTHTHTYNPPGPDLAHTHTHTCFHIHTKVLSADETAESAEKNSSAKRRPGGNREAVRKYREKKKAHAASLEDEIGHLRAINQQLIKRLEGQAALEAEIARMKCLLVDLRGRIEGEMGAFPYQKPGVTAFIQGRNPRMWEKLVFVMPELCSAGGVQILGLMTLRTVAQMELQQLLKVLTEYIMQDLNVNPKLPFEDNTFDVITNVRNATSTQTRRAGYNEGESWVCKLSQLGLQVYEILYAEKGPAREEC